LEAFQIQLCEGGVMVARERLSFHQEELAERSLELGLIQGHGLAHLGDVAFELRAATLVIASLP